MRHITALLLIGIPVTSPAHHSQAEFDATDITELSGEVVSVAWRMPHIEFRLRTVGQDGSVEEWNIEAGNAIAAGRMGLERDTLQVGFEVRVAGIASSRRAHRMLAGQILLPSGLEVIIDHQITPIPRWSPERYVDRRDSNYEFSGPLPDDGRGIFRIWTRDREKELWMLQPADYYPLTEAAETAIASWDVDDPADNQVLQCIPPGMPAAMGDPHPIEFVEMDGAIELRQQGFDIVRTINLEPAEDPASIDPSPLGYSVGRWEDNTLAITTTRVDTPYLNRRGVPMSEAAEIEERFTVDEANGHLNYVLTVTDPEYLSEPFVEEILWFWSEDAIMQPYNCSVSG